MTFFDYLYEYNNQYDETKKYYNNLTTVSSKDFTEWVMNRGEKKICKIRKIGNLVKFCDKTFEFASFGKHKISKKEREYNKQVEGIFFYFSLARHREKCKELESMKDEITKEAYEEGKEMLDSIFVESDLKELNEAGFISINQETLWIGIKFNEEKFRRMIKEYDVMLLNEYFTKNMPKYITEVHYRKIGKE